MAQRLLCGAERKLAAGAGRHITLHGGNAGQLLFQCRSGFGVAVVQHRHAETGLIKRPGRSRTDAPVAAGDQNAPAIARRRTRRSCLFGCRFFRLLRRFWRLRLRDRLRRRFFQHHHPGRFVHRRCCRCRLRLWRCGRFLRSLFRLRLLARQIERQFKFIFVQEYGPPVVFSAQQLCAVQEMFCCPSPPVSVHFFSGQSPALGVTGRCARWVSTKHH